MKKLLLSLLLVLVMMGNVNAQKKEFINLENTHSSDSFIKGKFNINVAAMMYHDYGMDDWLLSVDVLYGINDYFSAGLFISKLVYYGADARLHLLPLMVDPKYALLDLYANVQLGARTTEYDFSNTSFFINPSLGLSYSFPKVMGIFVDCGYSNTDGLNYKVGLNFRF